MSFFNKTEARRTGKYLFNFFLFNGMFSLKFV